MAESVAVKVVYSSSCSSLTWGPRLVLLHRANILTILIGQVIAKKVKASYQYSVSLAALVLFFLIKRITYGNATIGLLYEYNKK